MTGERDVVLVHLDEKPAFFAQILAIEPDVKPRWFQVRLLVLQVPLQVVTWILREPQIDGEPFTMGGHPVRLEKAVPPRPWEEERQGTPEPSDEPGETPPRGPEAAPPSEAEKTAKGRGKVVSLAERRKRDA